MFRVSVGLMGEKIPLGDKWMTAEKAIETAEAALAKGLDIEIKNEKGEVIFLPALKGAKNA